MTAYAEVLLPIPLERNFTYAASAEQQDVLRPGTRVAVPFGKNRLYTGLVLELHNRHPQAYEPKEIYRVLDRNPLVTALQLRHWRWIADYYMCTLGEVFRTALPSVFLLQSETRVLGVERAPEPEDALSEQESLVLEALANRKVLSVDEVGEIIERKNALPLLHRLLEAGQIRMQEKLQER